MLFNLKFLYLVIDWLFLFKVSDKQLILYFQTFFVLFFQLEDFSWQLILYLLLFFQEFQTLNILQL